MKKHYIACLISWGICFVGNVIIQSFFTSLIGYFIGLLGIVAAFEIGKLWDDVKKEEQKKC